MVQSNRIDQGSVMIRLGQENGRSWHAFVVGWKWEMGSGNPSKTPYLLEYLYGLTYIIIIITRVPRDLFCYVLCLPVYIKHQLQTSNIRYFLFEIFGVRLLSLDEKNRFALIIY